MNVGMNCCNVSEEMVLEEVSYLRSSFLSLINFEVYNEVYKFEFFR